MFKRFFIVIFIFIIITIYFYDRKIKQTVLESEKKIEQSYAVPVNPFKAKQSPQTKTTSRKIVVKLTPEDPAKYGMIVHDVGNTPRTAEDWENQLRENFEKHKTLDSENAQKALGTAKTSETDFQKKMQNLDSQIELIKQKLVENPLDQKANDQLQMLYQLKAVGNILRDKVVIPDFAPAQNAAPENIQTEISNPNPVSTTP